MQARFLAAVAVAATAALHTLPAHAEAGSAGFGALTSTTIAPGGTVDFQAVFTKAQDFMMSSYATVEPAPAEGTQFWAVSGETMTMETLSSVTLEVWSTSGEGQGIALAADAGAGSYFQHVWNVSLAFSQPGSYTVSLQGSWESMAAISDTSMNATRTCATDGGGVLACTGWELTAVGGSALAGTSGSFGPLSLTVQVVPEPATTALWLLGLGALGGWLRHRRRAAHTVSPR